MRAEVQKWQAVAKAAEREAGRAVADHAVVCAALPGLGEQSTEAGDEGGPQVSWMHDVPSWSEIHRIY